MLLRKGPGWYPSLRKTFLYILQWRPTLSKKSTGTLPKRWIDNTKTKVGNTRHQISESMFEWKRLAEAYFQEWTKLGCYKVRENHLKANRQTFFCIIVQVIWGLKWLTYFSFLSWHKSTIYSFWVHSIFIGVSEKSILKWIF